MKIHTLSLENINALYGTWHINFDDPAFTSQGIFAILGATGAGKTTLLDAICLAIYGATPRLGKISKSDNALMNLNASHCLARVELSIGKKTYAFEFSQRRAKSKTDGTLQEPKHEIYEKISGDFQLISDKKSQSEKLAAEILGMEFTQFTRSVMLAQGDFSAFLQSKPEERGEILEKITGTEIYAKIGAKTYELFKQKSQELDAQKRQLGELTLISDDDLIRLQNDIATGKHTIKALEHALQSLNQKIQQKNDHNDHIAAHHALTQEIHANEIALTNFAPTLARLTLATRHRELLPQFDKVRFFEQEIKQHLDDQQKLHQKRTQHQDHMNLWRSALTAQYTALMPHRPTPCPQTDTACLDELSHLLKTHEVLLTLDETWQTPLEHYVRQAKTLINNVHELYAQETYIKSLRQTKQLTKQKCDDAKHALTKTTEHLTKLTSELATQLNLDIAPIIGTQATPTHANVATDNPTTPTLNKTVLQTALSDKARLLDSVRETLNATSAFAKQYDSHCKTISEQNTKHTAIAHAAQALDTAKNTASEAKHRLAHADETYRHLDEKLRLTDEILTLKHTLQTLQDGSPCPLCGSPHHPYKNRPPATNQEQDDLKHALDVAKTALSACQTDHQNALLALARAESDHQHARLALDQHTLALSTQQDELVARWQALVLQLTATSTSLKSLCSDFDRLTPTRLQDLLNELSTHLKTEQENLQTAQELYQTLIGVESELHHKRTWLMSNVTEIDRLTHDEQSANHTYKAHLNALATPFLTLNAHMATLQTALATAFLPLKDSTPLIGDQTLVLTTQHAITTHLTGHFKTFGELIAIYEQKLNKETLPLFNARFETFATQIDELERLETQSKSLIKQVINAYHTQKDTLTKTAEQFKTLTYQMDALMSAEQEWDSKYTVLQANHKNAKHAFQTALLPHFKDEQDFLSHAMDDETFGQTKHEHELLLKTQTELTIKLDQTNRRLTALSHDCPNIADWSLGTLYDDLQKHQQEHQSTLKQLGANETLYQQGQANQAKHNALSDAIINLQKDVELHHTLSNIIGCSTGKRYRNIAQRLTLATLLDEANGVLAKMSDRYRLTPSDDPKSLLGIDVIDHYQADKRRQSKNLSGGETFMISLSLALGLSNMSSQNMQIDSLFLDEGFGTLDEDALDVALATLSELQATGKTIGIISHIGALKERISTQIHVKKLSGGKSMLTGAGVKIPQKY